MNTEMLILVLKIICWAIVPISFLFVILGVIFKVQYKGSLEEKMDAIHGHRKIYPIFRHLFAAILSAIILAATCGM